VVKRLCAYNRHRDAGRERGAAQFGFRIGRGRIAAADWDGTTRAAAGSQNYQVFFGTNSIQLFKFQ